MKMGVWWSQFLQKYSPQQKRHTAVKISSDDTLLSLNTILPSAQKLSHNLPDLLLASHKIAKTILAGSHGCKRAGQGNQFWQYRHAIPGESAQSIDWRQSAKSNKAYVKETEEENTQTLYLWCDVSGSMHWHSDEKLPTKQNRALLLGTTLSALLLNSSERVKLLLPHQQTTYFRGAHQLYPLAEQLISSTTQSEACQFPMPEQIASHSWIILISDFLLPYQEIHSLLQKLVKLPARILMIQVIDPAEQTLPYKGRIHFFGLEGEERILLSNATQSAQDYANLWENHQQQLKTLCQHVGVSLLSDFTNTNAAHTLLYAWNILSDHKSSRPI